MIKGLKQISVIVTDVNVVIVKFVFLFLFTEIMAPQVEEGSIRVEDKIYSAEKLSQLHPGGPLFIKVGFPFKNCNSVIFSKESFCTGSV